MNPDEGEIESVKKEMEMEMELNPIIIGDKNMHMFLHFTLTVPDCMGSRDGS